MTRRNDSPATVQGHWIRLGLSARGRREGLRPKPAATEAPAQAQPAPEPPVEPQPTAASYADKISLVSGGGARLDLMDLALAVRLSRAAGLSPDQAIRWVRADIAAASAEALPPAPPVDFDALFIGWMDEDEAREKAARARFYQKAQ